MVNRNAFDFETRSDKQIVLVYFMAKFFLV